MDRIKRHGTWAGTLRIAMVLITCLCVLFACLGCGDSKSADDSGIKGTGEKTTGKWVVELYMCGTDLESEGGAATNDLAELTENLPPEGVTFVIQTGCAKKWHNDEVKRKEIDRFVYDKDGLRRLDKLPDADMASPDTLASFLKFAQDKFEADHRILIMWNHGGGTVGGACYDERTQHIMSLNQMQDALASTYNKDRDKPPFDIVGFDCCLMATYGVANNFEGYGRYLVASQELEPGNGWYYTGIVNGFNEGVGSDPLVLAKVMCDSYMKGCEDVGTDDQATLSVTDLSKLPQLREAYEQMGVEAIKAAEKNPKKFFSRYARQAKKSANFGGNTRDTGYTNMIDMGDFAKRTEDLLPDTAKKVQQALSAAVLYKVSGALKEDSQGLSCYYPYQLEQQMENLSAIRCDLIWYDADKNLMYMFGNDANVDVDWEKGTCKDNFDGTWMMLDKHPLYTDVTEQTDDHITYAIPIKLNGEQMNLFVVYEDAKQAYRILGARAAINEQGAGDRNLVKLKPGDKVTTQQYAMSIDKAGKDAQLVDVATFQLGENFAVTDEPLADGTYAYVFDFIAPNGDYSMSDMASYELKGGNITTSVATE